MKNSLGVIKIWTFTNPIFCFQVFAFNTEEIERDGWVCVLVSTRLYGCMVGKSGQLDHRRKDWRIRYVGRFQGCAGEEDVPAVRWRFVSIAPQTAQRGDTEKRFVDGRCRLTCAMAPLWSLTPGCSAPVCQKRDGRSVRRADAEVTDSGRPDGCCECSTVTPVDAEMSSFSNQCRLSFVDIREIRRADGEDSQSVQEK